MPKKYIARTALIALLLLLCLIAGLVGGIDFAPDVRLIRQLQLIRADAPSVTLAAIAITQAGSAYGTFGGGLGVAAWLGWRGKRWLAAVLGATVLSERLVIDGMKLLIDRTRPTFDLHPVVTHSSSFPSGHAGNSMAVLLSIALIAAKPAHRVPAVMIAVLGSLLVGSTRPYLGVHWPSDVIGGWSLGAAIAILAWTISESRGSAAAQQQH
jgi:undecaprenyl-diphosphatase